MATQPPLLSYHFSQKPNQTIQLSTSNSILERGMNYNFTSVVANTLTTMPTSSAVGFGFHPTNEELVINYLMHKTMGYAFRDIPIIPTLMSANMNHGIYLAEYVLCKLKKKLDDDTKKSEANHLVASVSAESSCGMASDFENQNQSETRTSSSACLDSESSHTVASDFENQKSDEVMTDLSHKASLSSLSTDSYLENQNSSMLVFDLARDQSGSAMASYGETQHTNDLITNTSFKGSEESCHDLEYHNLVNMIPTSPHENWFSASDFEDQVSPFQLEGEYGPSMDIPSNLMNHSTRGEGESGSTMASDFEKQYLEKETEISDPNGDERIYLPSNTLDLVIQIPREKTDMSILEQGSSDNLVASNPENYSTEAMFPEFLQLTPEKMAELREFFKELEKSLSSPLQLSASSITEVTPSYFGFDPSVST